jgi:phospholipid-binding lipoprotein MlaA
MGLKIPLISGQGARIPAVVLAAGFVAACAGTPDANGINDPFEPTNRKIHGFNKGVDRMFVGPASKGYGVVPEPLKLAVGNVADTLDLPGDIVNNLLQLRLRDAGRNSLRLFVNVTAGMGGLFDIAGDTGLHGKPTDFGETLHVWGVGEGPYMELPLAGPSTARDTVGMLADIALNPVRLALPTKEANAATIIQLFSRLGDRDRFSETVDSILYESADSYAQARLLYLQNRLFELGQSPGGADTRDDGFIDPYADAASADAPSDDGFIDPYEDPYAQ